ncbi:ABC transporter ATP-binding protein [Nocardioides sp. C4-1]|uniref:ABC transporter ATP-binding protein n=1 Tax=Nocardioides sp. C4-1 TaxID=3151851 RepID=UPI0032659186
MSAAAAKGAPSEKAQDFLPSARRLVGLLAPDRWRMTAVLVLTVAAVALNVVAPLVIGKAIDAVFSGAIGAGLPAGRSKSEVVAGLESSGQSDFASMLANMDVVPGVGIDFGDVGRLLVITLLLYVVASAAQLWQAWLLASAVNAAAQRLRADVEAKVHRLPLAYLDGQPRGALMSRVTNDVDNVAQSLNQTLSQLIYSLLSVVGVVAMMFYISPLLTAVALVAVPLTALITKVVMSRSQTLFVQQWAHTGALNAQIEEAFTGHELITVFDRREEVRASFRATNDELMEVSYRAQFVSGLMMPIMMFVGNLSYVVICVVGALRVLSGSITLGEVTAFIQYSRQFTQPLSQVASMTNLLQSGTASAERVFELLDAPEEPADAHGTLTTPTRGRVAFESVSFGYGLEPLITGLDLEVQPGQTVAIVGPTGAGKTTLVNLLMRFYDVSAGRITLDGVDVASVPRADLRSKVAMVLQDTWLFTGTIRDNIRYGRPSASDAEVQAAAEAAFVDRFVRSLPDGYDTVLSGEDSALSAGERQLITLARAFVADPSLLVLDEATSSVDTRTELLLQRAMTALRADRTAFVIAHRLSTIRDADLIVVMDAGRVVEQGTHATLVSAGGLYTGLYRAQLAGAVEDDAPAVAPRPGASAVAVPAAREA